MLNGLAVRRGCQILVSLALVAFVCGTASAQTFPAPAPAPSLGVVVREIPRDLWKFLSWDTAVVLGVGGGAALIGHQWDDDLAGEVETNVRLNDAMQPGHTYGAFSFQALVGVALYTGGRVAGKGGLARTGADIMRAQILSQAYVQAIKFTAQRERPDGSNAVVPVTSPATWQERPGARSTPSSRRTRRSGGCRCPRGMGSRSSTRSSRSTPPATR